MAAQGAWLFRWRGLLPAALLVVLLLKAAQPANAARMAAGVAWPALCLSISLIGLWIRVLTIGHVPEHTSGRNARAQVADVLNTSGMYSLSRNPLYLGNFFMGLGVVAFTTSLGAVVVYGLLFWLYYERIIFAEETFLAARFGEAFEGWARRTPMVLPRFRNWTAPALPFSWRTVLRREYNGVVVVVASLFLLRSVAHLAGRAAPPGAGWWLLLGVISSAWLVARTVKRHTSWLRVVGR